MRTPGCLFKWMEGFWIYPFLSGINIHVLLREQFLFRIVEYFEIEMLGWLGLAINWMNELWCGLKADELLHD
jgi:hypothetical protein